MKTGALSFAFLLFLILSADARAPSAPAKIVFTYPSRSIASVDLYIAQERGFFRQEGLLADVVQPVPAANIFDFRLQQKVNQKLGIGALTKQIGLTIPQWILMKADEVTRSFLI